MKDNIINFIEFECSDNFQHDIYHAYKIILHELHDEYQYIYQIWNYIPNINENYTKFNLGRKLAFENKYSLYPVSTCVSNTVDNLISIYYEIGKNIPLILNNPRQTPPEYYPKKYGTPPVFSRAAIVDNKLRISGTASIIGSTTIHPGDIQHQTQETLLNIEAIIEQANKCREDILNPMDLSYTVYLKNRENSDIVFNLLKDTCGGHNIEIEEADMCREDLLIEIEAYEI